MVASTRQKGIIPFGHKSAHFCALFGTHVCVRNIVIVGMAAFDLQKRPRTLRGGRSGLGSGRRCFEVALF